MKKYSIVSLLTVFILLVVSKSFAQGFIREQLKKVTIVDFGKPFYAYTFEDIDGFKIEPKFDACKVPEICLEGLPSSPVTKSTAEALLANLMPEAIVIPSGGANFIESNFYIDYGHREGNVWVEDLTPNGIETQDPWQTGKMYLCVRGKYKVIKQGKTANSVDLTLDGVSCDCAQYLCPGGSHVHDTGRSPNVIKDLKSRVKEDEFAEEGESLEGDGSGVYQIIYFQDRTPPWIDKCEEERFPTIGVDKKICTGDWFTFDDLTIKENSSEIVNTRIDIGRIEDCPSATSGESWTNSEVWEKGEVQEVTLNGEKRKEGSLDTIISPPPNCCYGFMRYSVLAQDTSSKNNLNPGCASIREDDPNECYGLPDSHELYEDLGTSAGGAKPWPFSLNKNNFDRNKFNIKNYPTEEKIHEGYIRITDNDLPNILIRLTSAKDGEYKQIFFPPCFPAGEFTLNNSPDYRNQKPASYLDSNPSNQTDYNAFVGESRNILKECNYSEVINSRKRPYYTIFSLKSSDYMNEEDAQTKSRFLNNSEPAFINKHFRLEDQLHSDTDGEGKPDNTIEDSTTGEDCLGKRNGTWEEVVALVESLPESEVKIQEDVEYRLGVWLDDSVKWANCYTKENTCLTTIKPIPTGIVYAKITVDIPNQYPVYNREYEYSGDKSILEDIRFVFREPTSQEPINDVSELDNKKFPSITVEAKDYADNTRKIKLYFRVTDENANVKTLQRRHQQY